LNCFKLCSEHKLESIAFCCLGTGIYKYPVDEAAIITLYTTYKYLLKVNSYPKKIIFCVFTDQNYYIYKMLLPKFFKINKIENKSLLPYGALLSEIFGTNKNEKDENLVKEVHVTFREGMMGMTYTTNVDITKKNFTDIMKDSKNIIWKRAGINLPNNPEHYWVRFLDLTIYDGLQFYEINPKKTEFSITIYDY
jgi:hypothetical protein